MMPGALPHSGKQLLICPQHKTCKMGCTHGQPHTETARCDALIGGCELPCVPYVQLENILIPALVDGGAPVEALRKFDPI